MGQPTPEFMKDTTVAALLNLTVIEEEDIPANWETFRTKTSPVKTTYTIPKGYTVQVETPTIGILLKEDDLIEVDEAGAIIDTGVKIS